MGEGGEVRGHRAGMIPAGVPNVPFRESLSTYRRPCSPAPTRWSNEPARVLHAHRRRSDRLGRASSASPSPPLSPPRFTSATATDSIAPQGRRPRAASRLRGAIAPPPLASKKFSGNLDDESDVKFIELVLDDERWGGLE